jgi:GntR family transcriptional repressor for pyruvate dehydrogenase complex
MALPDEAITTIRSLIQAGELKPGTRLPPEQQLAARLGLSRNSMREAVRALESARVLDVRRGDGTYVTSLAPALLLEGLGFAIDLLQDNSLLEVVEVRRMLEPIATGTAATRITDDALAELQEILDKMYATKDTSEQMVHYDILFHRTVIAANGNETLSSVIEALSSKTLRARVWRGVLEAGAATRTLAEHQAIYDALAARDAALAQSAALLHINTSESWLRKILTEKPTEPRSRASNSAG